MEQEIKGFYDLTEASDDVWKEINPDLDMEATPEDLAYIRHAIQSFFAWTAKRLGEGKTAHFDQCGTFSLKLRAGREVQNFQTGERFNIPDYFQVEFNAAPAMEQLIQKELTQPVPDVK